MGLSRLLINNPKMFLMLAIPLLYSVIAHEVSHGFVAYLFGDNTAKRSGRLSLNPLIHLDPMGTLAVFLVGFGWAKPVPVNYSNLKNFRLGLICVSLAGCVANLLIATLAIFLLKFFNFDVYSIQGTVLYIVAQINVILCAFNLIPIPPLDGSKILMGFLPYRAQLSLARMEPYGMFIVLILLFTRVLEPVIIFIYKLLLSIIVMLLSFIS